MSVSVIILILQPKQYADILNWFRDQVDVAGGGSYQTLINNALREHMKNQQEPIEVILRRVAREELTAVK